MNQYDETVKIITNLVGDEYLYFSSPLIIKPTPHSPKFIAWGASVSPDGVIYLMDEDQEWTELVPGVGNADIVITSLYQRMKLIAHQTKVAV